MALQATVAVVEAAIAAIADNGFANGVPYANSATPATSHVRAHLKWIISDDGTPRTLTDHICHYAAVHLDTAGRTATADKADVETAVIVAVARLSAARYYGWTRASFNASEVVTIPLATPARVVHADHEQAVADALTAFAPSAARYMGLFYYNSISYETSNHHHLPAVTKRLATTTILLSGLKDWIAGDAEKEGSVFHDMFHPLSDTEKSNAARKVAAREHLSGLKFDNLRKRIPVKAPDSGVALNYAVLYTKAIGYRHDVAHLPTTLAAPANLAAAVAAYETAATPADVVVAVARLRRLSAALEEPSAYLAGFILGCEARATNDADLELRTAARTTTILGSPAYARAASEFSGTFATAKENGFKVVAASVPDQVIPRVAAAIVAAAAL